MKKTKEIIRLVILIIAIIVVLLLKERGTNLKEKLKTKEMIHNISNNDSLAQSYIINSEKISHKIIKDINFCKEKNIPRINILNRLFKIKYINDSTFLLHTNNKKIVIQKNDSLQNVMIMNIKYANIHNIYPGFIMAF